MSEEKTVKLNGAAMKESEFKKLKENIEQDKSQQLVEVSPGVYKTRFLD